MKICLTLGGLALAAVTLGCGNEETSVSAGDEVAAASEVKLELPAVPDFKMPATNPDGSQSVQFMRLMGGRFLDKTVKVTGYVVFHYDLATCAQQVGEKLAVTNPRLCDGQDPAACAAKVGQKSVDDDPAQCTRRHFYLADSKDGNPEQAIWVVEVPRALRKDELKDEMKAEEAKRKGPPPVVNIGDKVTVEGEWKQRSPYGFIESDGLLVYQAMTPAT